MKEIKICAIAAIITALIINFCVCILPAQAESAATPETMPKLTVVVSCDQLNAKLWIIECLDKNGDYWTFYDESSWKIGDIANLLMWFPNSNIKDGEIIDVVWEGYSENPKTFFQTIGWH